MPTYNVGNSLKQTATAGAPKTVLMVTAPATRNLTISAFSVGGYSIDPNHTTGNVKLIITDGVGTSSTAVTPVPVDLRETAALHTSRETFSAEPATNPKIVGGPWPLSPVSTLFAWQFSPDECIVVPANKSLSIVCNFPGANQDIEASMTVKE